jgi:hypothetical protein
MNPKTFVNRFIFFSAIAGTILAVYVVAKAQTTGNAPTPGVSKLGARIVAEENTRGAVACARRGCDSASDDSAAISALAGQSSSFSDSSTSSCFGRTKESHRGNHRWSAK